MFKNIHKVNLKLTYDICIISIYSEKTSIYFHLIFISRLSPDYDKS